MSKREYMHREITEIQWPKSAYIEFKPKTKAVWVIKDIIEKAKKTHEKWLCYLKTTPNIEPRIKATAGDIQHQEKWINLYDRALDALGSLQAENEVNIKRIKELEEQIRNLNDLHQQEEKRMLKALKEQGFAMGPFVEGPEIRD